MTQRGSLPLYLGIILTVLVLGPGLVMVAQTAWPEQLTAWVARAHGEGLTAALAGKLTAADLPMVVETGADIVGVRGAACESGRSGPIVASRIRALKTALLTSFHLTHR